MLPDPFKVEEYEKRPVEELRISHAEYVLIQQIRAIRKKSLVQIDVGGDGVPKRLRVVEACLVELN
jgi:hypothetical protein